MERRANLMKKEKGGIKLLVVILLLLILIAGGLLLARKLLDKPQNETSANLLNNSEIDSQVPEKEPVTFAGNERPIAFMLDNNINAMPQAGLLEADIIYEMIVEGGETRLMAVMKNKNPEKIGPLRSARHYYLDYALENDAIYVHFGQSPQAKSDITTLGISDINGIYESSTYFWRVSSRYAPHNVITSMEKMEKLIETKGFRTTTTKKNVLNYVAEEFNLENGEEALEITIPYSTVNAVKYTYNPQTKTYIRYSRNKKQVDWETEKNIQVKNIIITKCKNTTLNDGSNAGRQTLSNIGTLDGYYITNGKIIPITCTKTSRAGQTVYQDLDGNEINVNDGKTFIQICPIDSKITFGVEED